jgi:hypothetical protein
MFSPILRRKDVALAIRADSDAIDHGKKGLAEEFIRRQSGERNPRDRFSLARKVELSARKTNKASTEFKNPVAYISPLPNLKTNARSHF